MAIQNVLDFFEKIKSDSELTKKVKSAETIGDLSALAKENGFDITSEQVKNVIKIAQKVYESRKNNVELTDGELETVSGGLEVVEGAVGKSVDLLTNGLDEVNDVLSAAMKKMEESRKGIAKNMR